MSFVEFAESYGLIIDRLSEGQWTRVKTTDKQRKRNGAYKYLGVIGFVQNHATMADVVVWRPDQPAQRIDRAELKAIQRKAQAHQESRWIDAVHVAEDMIHRAGWSKHPYLAAKGFPADCGWVLDGELLVPMREMRSNALASLQRITETGEKRFLAGGKAKSCVHKLGNERARERWLVEGYATGLSVREALRDLRRSYQVIVCFSAGNLKAVAPAVARPAFVFADNDLSGVGAQAAEDTGLPWCLSPGVGTDANDWHCSHGLRALVETIRVTASERAP